MHGLGELKPEPITFSHPARKQTRSSRLRFLKRKLEPNGLTIAAGIPTTTYARTILDLIDYGEDLSLVSSVLADAERLDPALNVKDEVNARSGHRGFARNFPLYDYLKEGEDSNIFGHESPVSTHCPWEAL